MEEDASSGEQVGEQVAKILEYAQRPRTKQEILIHLGLSPVYLNYQRHILSLIRSGYLELTIPNKPRSRNQRYLTTESGRALLGKVPE